jgi:hypothetical protein
MRAPGWLARSGPRARLGSAADRRAARLVTAAGGRGYAALRPLEVRVSFVVAQGNTGGLGAWPLPSRQAPRSIASGRDDAR